MATQSREPTAEAELAPGLLGQIEVHSIDWIPDTERCSSAPPARRSG
jgi:hypothetical protein